MLFKNKDICIVLGFERVKYINRKLQSDMKKRSDKLTRMTTLISGEETDIQCIPKK